MGNKNSKLKTTSIKSQDNVTTIQPKSKNKINDIEDNNQCQDITKCNALNRLIEELKYYQTYNENNKENKMEAISKYFIQQIINDYTHMRLSHLNSNEENNNKSFAYIYNKIMNDNNQLFCSIISNINCKTLRNTIGGTTIGLYSTTNRYIDLMDCIHSYFIAIRPSIQTQTHDSTSMSSILIFGFVRTIKCNMLISSLHVFKPIVDLTFKYYYVVQEYFAINKNILTNINKKHQVLDNILWRSSDNLTIKNRHSNGARTGYGHITINSNDLMLHEWRFEVTEMSDYAYGIKLGMIEFKSNEQLIHVRENKFCFASNGGIFGQNKCGHPHTVFAESDKLLMTLDFTKKDKRESGVLHFSVLNKQLAKYEIKKTYDNIKIGDNVQYKMCVILDGGGFNDSDQTITLVDYNQKSVQLV